jgi:hypothetical protein
MVCGIKMFASTFGEVMLLLVTSYRESITGLDPLMLIRGSKSKLGNKRHSEKVDHYSIRGINEALSSTVSNHILGNQGQAGNNWLIQFIFRQ